MRHFSLAENRRAGAEREGTLLRLFIFQLSNLTLYCTFNTELLHTCDGEGHGVRGGPSSLGLVRLKPEVIVTRVAQPDRPDLDRAAGVAAADVAGDPGGGERVCNLATMELALFKSYCTVSDILILLFQSLSKHVLIVSRF